MDEITVELVWRKGIKVNGYDPVVIRQDVYGSLMSRNEYGNRQSTLGWEIDHVIPSSKGGSDDITNLRPLNWKNNARRQDDIFK